MKRNNTKNAPWGARPADVPLCVLFEELEPRLLLSADSLGGLDALISSDNGEPVDTAGQVLPVHQEFSQKQASEALPASTETADRRHELVFVDGGIDDHETLVAGFIAADSEQRRIEVVVLDPARNGIEQISETLAGYDNLDAVHMLSHGDDASLRLGSTTLDGESLERYQAAIAGWAGALDSKADLLLYGCNLAANSEGQFLVDALSRLTGADVAASDDLTGHAEKGGDWELEYRAGEIETTVAVSAGSRTEYQHTLANITGSAGDDVLASTAGDDVIDGLGGNDTVDYSAATSAVTVDVTITTAQNTGGAGTDTLSSIEGVIGSAYDDTFAFSSPVNGAAYTVDGGTGGNDTIDLTGYNIANAIFANGRVTIDTGTGFSFNIDYSNIDIVQFGDVTATVLTADTSAAGFSGSATYIEGDAAFTVNHAGGGTIDWSYVAATNSLSISDTNSTSAASAITITSHDGSNFSIDSIASDGVVGSLTTNVDINQITLTGDDNRFDTITINNGAGTLSSITYFGDMNTGSTITIDANVGTFALGPGLDIDSGTFLITGDLRTVDVPNFVGGTVIAERVIGQFDSVADSLYSNNFVTPTKVTLDGSTTTESAPNVAPTAADGTVVFAQDSVYTFTAADFGYNDLDGDAFSQVQITSLEHAGDLKLDGAAVTIGQVISRADIDAGDLTFTPQPGQSGTAYDSFRFKVSDGVSRGAPGTVLTSFAAPAVSAMSSLAFDGTNLWLTDSNTSTVYELDTAGTQLSSFAGPGTGDVSGIAFDGTNLWVVDRGGDTVYEMTTTGSVLSSFATPGTDSRGLTWDGTNLWLIDGSSTQIHELTTAGAVVSSFAWPDDFMRDLAWDGASLWATDSNDSLVYELSTAGTVLSSFASPNTGAAGIAFDGTEFWHADTDLDDIYQLTSPDSTVYSAAAYTMTVDVTPADGDPVDIAVVGTTGGGLSLNEDGGNDAYFIADSGLTIPLSRFTLEVQFAAASLSDTTPFVSYNTPSGDELSLNTVAGTNALELDFGTGPDVRSTAIDYDAALLDGQRHTLSTTWDNAAGDWQIFIDGVLIDSGTGLSAGTTLQTGGALIFGLEQDAVGGGFNPVEYFSGTLYDARLFDDLRSAAEINANLNRTVAYDEGNLVANWRFDDLSVDGVITEAVSGNNLSLAHASGAGFSASTPVLSLAVSEAAATGTTVGLVSGTDADRGSLITSLLAADPDLVYSAETGKFYKLMNTKLDWDVASTTAQTTALNGVNGQLASIQSAAEQEILGNLSAAFGSSAWVGATDQTTEGEWRWVDGGAEASQFWQGDWTGDNVDEAYANWQAGQPDNVGATQHYLALQVDGAWNDGEINKADVLGYLVEWDADEVLDATDALLYSVVSQTVAGAFTVDSDSGTITVADGSLLDYATNATHTLTVRVTDSDGGSYDEAFTISLSSASSLWLTTEDDVSSPSGASGLDSWTGGEVLSFDDPAFNPGSTSGTLNRVFNLDDFVQDGDARVDSIHYVGTDMTVGSNAIQLRQGDVLMSSVFAETLVNSDASTLAVTSRDVFVYRPDSLVDYSLGGSFITLINGADLSIEVEGITLVESSTTIGAGGGATTVNAGDFLLTDRDNPGLIYRLEPGVLGDAASNTGTLTVLADVRDVGVTQNIHGIELVEKDTVVGDRTLTAGQILVSLFADDTVAGTPVSRADIFILDVTTTGDTTVATADPFFTGGDIGFDTWQESPWGISLLSTASPYNDAPSFGGTLNGNPSFTEDGPAVVLDADVVVSDAELDSLNGGLGNYAGASLTLARNGGASAEDVLSFNDGNGITLVAGNLIKNSQIVASFDVTTTPGEVIITFTDANGETPTSADVDNILRQITYSNSNDMPPASSQIDWIFDDGNAGAQGIGGSLQALGSTTVTITPADDPLVVSTTGNTVLFTEDAGATGSLFAAAMDTVETGDTVSQVVLTLANVEAGDTLFFGATSVDLNTNGATGPDANGFTYSVSGAGASPVVTISHAGTDDATVNTMLNSLVFNNTTNNDPSTTARTVTLTSVADSGSGTTADGTVATVNVAKADDPLAVSTTGNTVLFTEDAGATGSLFAAAMDTVETGDTVSQVVLTLANVEAGDTLFFGATSVDLNTNGATGPDANGFTYSVSGAGASPVVTISHAGTDDATVNTMLNSLVFNNTTNNDPSTTARTVTLTSVTDSGSGTTADGTGATVNVATADDPINVATTGNTVLFTEDAGATGSLFAAAMDTVETGDTVSQVVLTLANVEAGDTLFFGATSVDLNTNGATGPDANGFTYSVSGAGASPVVTISHAGTDDATVNTMLNSLVFNNTTNNDPSTTARTVTLTSVTDSGSGTTADGTVATVNVAKANDNPSGAGSLSTTALNDNAGATNLFAGLTVSDVDSGENDLSVTITLTNATAGTISGGGFTDLGGGVYQATGLTVAQADTALDNVTFTPTDNTGPSGTFNTDISVTVNDQGGGGEQDVLTATTVTITRVNDNPGGAGSLSATSLNDNAGATNLFAGLMVSDVDVGEADLSVTITLTNAAAGAISGGGFTDLGGGVYQATGLTVAQADTALDNVTFTPTDNTGPNGTFNTDISVTVNDQGGGGEQDVLTATTVTITRVNDNPGGAGSLSTTSLNDNAGATSLFAGLTVSDVDVGENDLSLTITLTNAAAGTISGGGFTDLGGGVYQATGLTVAQADTALDNVTFIPTDNTGPSGTFATDIRVTVNDQGGGGEQDVLTATTVTITRVNDNPGGAGSLSTTTLNDNAGATNLFAGLVVSDVDVGENDLSLTITLTNATAGTISGGGFTDLGGGVYQATGLTVAQADTALDNVQFTPTDNTGPSGTFNTDISVSVNDQGGGGEQDVLAATTVTITRVNDNPGGAGSLSTTSLNDNAGATNLFAGLTVSDVDVGESDLSLTITLTNAAAGTISGGGFTDLGGGVYQATGLTVATADTALDNVQFTPTDNTGPSGTFNTDISVSVNDQGGGGEQDVLAATTVTITRVNDNPGGAGSLNTTSLNDNAGATNLFAGLTVSDVDVGESDLSLTITLTNAAAGTISGGGFTDLGGGVYQATGLTVAQADTALDNVQFTPTDNTGPSGTFNTDISVTVNDQGGGGEQDVLTATTVTITRVNDNPGGAGSLSATSLNDNAGATNLFAGLMVSDVDVGEADLSVTITLTNAAAGAISGGGFTDLGGGVYQATGLTVAQADTALDNVTFTPTDNTGPNGTFNTDISVTVNDQGGGGEQDVLTATTVTITRVNDNPGGAGSLSTTSLNDNAGATSLFAGLTVSDVDVGENDLSLTITLTNAAAGTISGGGFTDLGGGIYRATGFTVATADTALDNVVFTPTDNTGPSGTFSTDISVTVNDQGGGGEQDVLTATTVTITRVNDNPSGAGSLSTTSLNDNAGATNLFAGLTVSDVDVGESDLSLTITLTNAAAGTISGGGFTDLGGGIYRATGLTVAQADTALDNVTFTPTDNTGPSGTFSTDISVTVNDQGGGGEQDVLAATTVTITRVNDNPGGAGSLSTTSLNDNAGATNLFAGLTVSDVDVGESDLSLTITLTNAAAGTISGGGFTDLGGGVYQATGLTVATADTALDNVQFTPTDNTGPSGTFNTDISVSVNDQGGGGEQDVLAATTVTITRVNDNPGGAGSLNTTSLNDNAGATNLFAGLTVSDVDVGESDLSLTITLTNAAAGTISGGGFTDLGGGVYQATGLTVAQADTALDNVQFTPTDNTGPSGTFNTDISVTVNDQGGGGEQDVLTATTVTITRVNDNPGGAGSLSATSLNDNAGATNLFAGLMVSDVDVGEADLSVTITLTNAAAGAISGGGFTDLGGGVYQATGLTVAQADTALDNVTFTPTDNTGPNGTFNTDISVTVNDQGGGGEQDVLTATTVTITRVNDNPGGAGSLSTTSLNDNAGATSLFAGLTVSDVDVGENDLSLTITLTNAAAGTISGGGFTDLGGGIYRATGFTVATADTALDNVVFTPTDNTGPSGTFSTDISVTVNDQGGGGEQDVLTATTVTITRVNDNPSGAGSLSTTSLNDNAGATNLFAGLTVSDVDVGESDLSLTITLTNAAAGTISGGGFTDLGGGIYRATGLTVAQADTALDNVTFTPTDNTGPSGTFSTDISVTVNDQGGGGEQDVLTATTVTITRVNDNPGGAGSLSTTTLNDNAGATNLFAGLVVSDLDVGENDLSLTIMLTNATAGAISGGGFTDLGGGVYRATGLTVAQADTALDNVQFTPADSTGVGGTFASDIKVTVNDQGGGGEQVVLPATTVTITQVSAAPIIPEDAEGPPPLVDNPVESDDPPLDELTLSAVLAPPPEADTEEAEPSEASPVEEGSRENDSFLEQVVALMDVNIAGEVTTDSDGADGTSTATPDARLVLLDMLESDRPESMHMGLQAIPQTDVSTGTEQALMDEVAKMQSDMVASGDERISDEEFRQGMIKSAVGTLSVGSVSWLLRAGSLLTGVFSSIPMWSSMDPLPVLSRSKKEEKRQRKEVADSNAQDDSEQQMGRILGQSERHADSEGPHS